MHTAGRLDARILGMSQEPQQLLQTSKFTVVRQTQTTPAGKTKTMVLDAPSASRFIVSAAIEGEEGIGLFAVSPSQAGVELEAYPLLDGTRAADVRFTSVELPAEALVVGGNRAAEALCEAIDRASIALEAL